MTTKVLSFDDAIDELMVLLQIQRPYRARVLGNTVPLAHFSQLETTFSKRYGVLHRAEEPRYFDDVVPDVVPDADVSSLQEALSEDWEYHRDDVFMLRRFRMLQPSEYRGRVWRSMKYVASFAFGNISIEGHFQSSDLILGSMDGIEWWCLGPSHEQRLRKIGRRITRDWAAKQASSARASLEEAIASIGQASDPSSYRDAVSSAERLLETVNRYRSHDSDVKILHSIDVALGVSLAREYEWSVSVGYGAGITVRVPVSPPAIKDLFRLRDIPEGSTRRTALRHWVASHWRKKHDDPNAETEVRQHFRGRQRFNWNGLICEVVPSKYSMTRVEAAFEEAPRRRRREGDGTYRMVDLALSRAGVP